jgi:hypothetical protein
MRDSCRRLGPAHGLTEDLGQSPAFVSEVLDRSCSAREVEHRVGVSRVGQRDGDGAGVDGLYARAVAQPGGPVSLAVAGDANGETRPSAARELLHRPLGDEASVVDNRHLLARVLDEVGW